MIVILPFSEMDLNIKSCVRPAKKQRRVRKIRFRIEVEIKNMTNEVEN